MDILSKSKPRKLKPSYQGFCSAPTFAAWNETILHGGDDFKNMYLRSYVEAYLGPRGTSMLKLKAVNHLKAVKRKKDPS